tara:strand:+ start:79 stop:474 length:396 start_codon:yes stop_codon:yes gene_type:complete
MIKTGSDFSGVVYYDIPETVIIRSFEVDVIKLQTLLKNHKNTTIKNIAIKLNRPKTEVAHWFRTDKFFSIPDPIIWFDLKKLLNITDNSHDKSITIFKEQDSVYDQSNRVYNVEGIAPTITSTNADIRIIL